MYPFLLCFTNIHQGDSPNRLVSKAPWYTRFQFDHPHPPPPRIELRPFQRKTTSRWCWLVFWGVEEGCFANENKMDLEIWTEIQQFSQMIDFLQQNVCTCPSIPSRIETVNSVRCWEFPMKTRGGILPSTYFAPASQHQYERKSDPAQ